MITATLTTCLYCQSEELTPVYRGVADRLEYVPGTRDWSRCSQCRSLILNPQPAVEELAGFYPPVYSFTPDVGQGKGLMGFLANLEYRYFFRPQYTFQAKQLARATGGAKNGPKLLDIGAGRGLRLIELRKLGFEVHALDLQEEVVRNLNEDLKIPAVCADVSEASRFYEPESFDIVSAYYLMEHINDVQGFLEDCSKLLKPGGWIAIAIPFIDSPQAGWFRHHWINVTEAPRHLTIPSQAGAKKAFEAAGFVNPVLLPDSPLNCAGAFASSGVRGASITHVYSGGRWLSLAKRFLGGALMLSALPFCWVENHILKRPAMGVLLARKPGGASC
jgi:SAM-dependent methyltransferase